MFETEPKISYSAAARLLEARGLYAHPTTLYRWAERGYRGVRLEHVYFGGRHRTSAAAVDRFLARVAESREAAAAAT